MGFVHMHHVVLDIFLFVGITVEGLAPIMD